MHKREVGDDLVVLRGDDRHEAILVQSVIARTLRAVQRKADTRSELERTSGCARPLLSGESVGCEEDDLGLDSVPTFDAVLLDDAQKRNERTLKLMDEDERGRCAGVLGNWIALLSIFRTTNREDFERRGLLARLWPREQRVRAAQGGAGKKESSERKAPWRIHGKGRMWPD